MERQVHSLKRRLSDIREERRRKGGRERKGVEETNGVEDQRRAPFLRHYCS